MARPGKKVLSPDHIVIYCSSVWGGFSWALTSTSDKAKVESACEQLEGEVEGTFVCCTLCGLISAKSGNCDIDDHWKSFVGSVENDEYEQFEGLKPVDLKPKTLLESGNHSLLLDLLQQFFNTTVLTDFDGLLAEHGVAVVAQTE